MKSKQNRKKLTLKGFTLVELLVAISILGIITLIALPQLSNIQDQNKQTKYKKYAETMITSGKLYVDSYSEDLFGYNTSGCVDISYSEMKDRGLLKDIKIDGTTCSGDKTFVRVWKSNDHYTYETSIVCKKDGKEVYSQSLVVDGCTNKPDDVGPNIRFSKNGTTTWVKQETTKIQLYDEYGMLENAKIRYAWFNGETQVTDWKEANFYNKRYAGKATYNESTKTWSGTPIELEVSTPSDVSGNYYLKVEPVDVRDVNGNYLLSTAQSNSFKLDNTPPTCGTNNGSTIWTNLTRTITLQCTDAHSQCKKTSYSETYPKTGKSQPKTIKQATVTISDNVGNTKECTYNVYIDQEAPNPPTDGNIGKVSGSNTTGTIQTPSSPTTDVNDGSGFKEIRYVVNNTGKTPSTTSFKSTSRNFSRRCATSYYAYSVAVDNAGNISTVYPIGSTADGKNEYSDYGACSAQCDGGIKTRTNSCALITTDLSASCNERACCTATTVTYEDGDTCTAVCGGGTYNQLAYSTYDNTKRCPTFDLTSGGSACKTQECCSSTEISHYGEWGTCSSTCGSGKKYRDIYLKSVYDGRSCGTADEQDETTCTNAPCEHTHYYGSSFDNPSGNYIWTTLSYSKWSNCTHSRDASGNGNGVHTVTPNVTNVAKAKCTISGCNYVPGFIWCPYSY